MSLTEVAIMFPTTQWLGNSISLAGLSVTFAWSIIMKAGLWCNLFSLDFFGSNP